MKVQDLSVEELKELIRETVTKTLLETLADPDAGLEVRGEFTKELEESIARVESGEPTIPAEKVAEDLGIAWPSLK